MSEDRDFPSRSQGATLVSPCNGASTLRCAGRRPDRVVSEETIREP
jgi:hypothetical protein